MYEDGYIELQLLEVAESPGDVCGDLTPNKCLTYSTGRFRNGAVGLCNIGVTGCLNPLLQTLYMNKNFTDLLCQVEALDDNVPLKQRLAHELLRLFQEMQSSEDAVPPYRLLRCLPAQTLTLFAQSDVADAFSTLLNLLLANIPNPRLEERLRAIYSTPLEERLTCQRCFHRWSRHNDVFTISVSVPHSKYHRKMTLERALWKYFRSQEVGEDQGQCPKCPRGSRVTQVTQLRSLPHTLNIHVRRLAKKSGSRVHKINRSFSFPPVLDLLEVLELEYLPDEDPVTPHYNYRLFAVIAHSGAASAGYFCTYIHCAQTNSWYFFNDSSVCKVSWDDVKCTYGNTSFHWGVTACLLVYVQSDVK